MQWYFVDDSYGTDPPDVSTMFLRAEVPGGIAYVLWNATLKQWLFNPAAMRYLADGTATPVAEDEARMWAERLGASLQAALDLVAEFGRPA
jgi:hypothetical protein